MDFVGNSIYQSKAFPARLFGNAFAYTFGLLEVTVICSMNPVKCLSGSPLLSNRLNCGSLNLLGRAVLSNQSVKGILVMVADGIRGPRGILMAVKDTTPPNTVPLAEMMGKRLIAFKKVKVVKMPSSPRHSTTAELPPRSSPGADLPTRSSPATVEPCPIYVVDLPYKPLSSSLLFYFSFFSYLSLLFDHRPPMLVLRARRADRL
ncbi:hypothetical protein LIER_36085 [Lithospermum erythrorhizon]|uniref:Ribosomal protein L14 n=1 Tax=Lithospermum erythrorhizon TaxID=34254 RepID=A0AAV3P0I5_LITER